MVEFFSEAFKKAQLKEIAAMPDEFVKAGDPQAYLSPEFIRARDMLLPFSSDGGKVIIAGGCLRDAYHRVNWRDIDVFVGPGFAIENFNGAKGVPNANGWYASEDRASDEVAQYEDYFGERILDIWKLNLVTVGDSAPIQVIRWNRPVEVEEVVVGFDFSFNWVAFDGQNVWTTKTFLTDMVSNRVTFMLEGDTPRWDSCQARMERLKPRYPDKTWVWPERQQKSVRDTPL